MDDVGHDVGAEVGPTSVIESPNNVFGGIKMDFPFHEQVYDPGMPRCVLVK